MSEELVYQAVNQIISSKDENSHTACYCEENVWKLCEKVKLNNEALLDKCYAVFISNPHQSVALRNQKAGNNNEGLVIWDYHVIFIVICPKEGCFVFDLDSCLLFPCSFETYVEKTFYPSVCINKQFISFFRMVNAVDYLAEFSSDRRHMKKPDDSWISPPPSWSIIKAKDCDFNLDEYFDMTLSTKGDVLSITGFCSKVASLTGCSKKLLMEAFET